MFKLYIYIYIYIYRATTNVTEVVILTSLSPCVGYSLVLVYEIFDSSWLTSREFLPVIVMRVFSWFVVIVFGRQRLQNYYGV